MKKSIKKAVLTLLLFMVTSTTHGVFGVQNPVYTANRSAGKCVALTFDDGPHPIYTEQILEILKENNAKATFFVIGKNVESYPDLLKKEYEAGHEIGNHTYSHPNMKKISTDNAVEEIKRTGDIIYDIIGKRPSLFRSPGGVYSDELVTAVEEIGCIPVLWSWRQDTRDWSMPSVDKIVSTVLDNLQEGDIILFHDYNGKNSPTPKALKIILPELKKRGYSFVTVSELMDIRIGEKEVDEQIPNDGNG